ncbi:MAG: YbjQ family protein [Candidatus Aminicenantia bacterium]
MIVLSTETVPGKTIKKSLGLVKGNTIRARFIGKDIVALMRNITGGEIREYTKMMAEAREQAIDRMIEEAEKLGANAIVNVRFSTSYIMQSAAEILVWGTAVIIE